MGKLRLVLDVSMAGRSYIGFSSALGTEHWVVILIVILGKGWDEVGRRKKAAFFPADAQEDPRAAMNRARRA